jgi:hypothetical protein
MSRSARCTTGRVLPPAEAPRTARVSALASDPGLGWERSTLYTLPPLVLVSTTVLFLAVLTGVMLLILSGYRRLAAHSRRAPLIYILVLLVIFAALIVLGDTVALAHHYLAFGHGYTIWMDVVMGLLTLGLPVLAFELLQRRGHRGHLSTPAGPG